MNTIDPKSDNLRERIAKGECVSPYTTEHCPVCVDRCEAFHWRVELSKAMMEANVKPSDPEKP